MSAAARYERYVAWCRMLGVEPTNYEHWYRIQSQIGEAAS